MRTNRHLLNLFDNRCFFAFEANTHAGKDACAPGEMLQSLCFNLYLSKPPSNCENKCNDIKSERHF
jgi:hypothetical protein